MPAAWCWGWSTCTIAASPGGELLCTGAHRGACWTGCSAAGHARTMADVQARQLQQLASLSCHLPDHYGFPLFLLHLFVAAT